MKPIFFAVVLIATAANTQQAPDTGPRTVEHAPGGYQPAAPALSGPVAPGQTPIFVPSTQTPSQAYPPPAPLSHYPFCKRGQFDKCMQRGG